MNKEKNDFQYDIERFIKEWSKESKTYVKEVSNKEYSFGIIVLYPPTSKEALHTLIYQEKDKDEVITLYSRIYFPIKKVKVNTIKSNKLRDDLELAQLLMNCKFIVRLQGNFLDSIFIYKDIYIDTLMAKGQLLQSLDEFDNCKIYFIKKIQQIMGITPKIDVQIE